MYPQKKLTTHLTIDDVKEFNEVSLFGFIWQFRKTLYGNHKINFVGYVGVPNFNEVVHSLDDYSDLPCGWLLRTQVGAPNNLIQLHSDGERDKLVDYFNKEYPTIKFQRNGDVSFMDEVDLLKAINNSIDFVNATLIPESSFTTTHIEIISSDKENSMSNFIKSLVSRTCNVDVVTITVNIGHYQYSDMVYGVTIDSEKGRILSLEETFEYGDVADTMTDKYATSKALKMILTALMTEGLAWLSKKTELTEIQTYSKYIY
jgi:hypothetical protein